ncbi:MAG: TonB-dependent receptor [bacterium]|nr:TonB-dependent receptor [Candidatus Kapabacteria bacterium]
MGFDTATATATAAAMAPMLAAGYARVPLGTVTPEGVSDSTAILMVPRNFGLVNIGGIDLSADYRLNDDLAFGATLSMTDDAVMGTSDSVPMNAPPFKASVATRYRNSDLGLRAEARLRYSSSFDMASGVYRGEIPAYGLLDLSVGYKLPWVAAAEVLVSATNLLDNVHREFVGAPEIGRLVTARVTYRF